MTPFFPVVGASLLAEIPATPESEPQASLSKHADEPWLLAVRVQNATIVISCSFDGH